jgi:multiple sugar transport system permease protein
MTAPNRVVQAKSPWNYAGAGAVLAFSLAPFLWIFIASITPELKTEWGMLSGRRVAYLPSAPTLQNYIGLLKDTPFLLYFRNSAIIATGNMLLTLLVASLGAYGFVRFRFPGRSAMLVAMLVAYTIPSVVLLVPLLVIFRSYGLVNTHLGMILAEATHSAPFVLLLMINYFSTLPRELEEAGQVDGCSRLGTLWRIVIPLAVPGLVAGGLLAFIMSWNDFLFAFLFTTTNNVKTLPVMMRLFALGEPAVWGISAAGAVLTTAPVALIFLLFQRMLMSGLAAGAMKG